MRLRGANGFVGIGTTNPVNTLHVVGSATVTSNLFVGGTFTGNGGGLTNLSASAITGGLTTNIVINGATFYITNGIIMDIQ
jgi:hypothetical protein